jgi:hypothetical protein
MTWGFVAGAAATVVGSVIAGNASQSAANTQADAAKQSAQTAANAQMQGLQFVQQQEAPYQQAGQQALGQYQSLLSGGAPNFDISKLPGYQFSLQQGMGAIENSAAARGTSLSGNTLRDLQGFGQGLASTNFNQYMQQLAGLANMGQAAASGVANQGAGLLSGAGASLAGGQMAAGNALAAGQVGQANIWGGLLNSPTFQRGIGAGFNNLFSGAGNLNNPAGDPNNLQFIGAPDTSGGGPG